MEGTLAQMLIRTLVKRLFDVGIAIVALVVLSPVLAAVAVMVRVFLGSPVFFTQSRPGLDGKLFRMYKFRTMRDARDRDGQLLPDAERVTRFGVLLRWTSLDELPELWNVLRGEMGLVGPRPLLPEYLPFYTQREHLRHSVRPGLTGLAQISGRNHLGWDERLELDVQYAESHTMWLDLKIMLLTTYKVLLARDVALGTLPPFHVHRQSARQSTSELSSPPPVNQQTH